MKNNNSLFIRIATLLIIVIGFVSLYFQIAATGKSVDGAMADTLRERGSMNVVLMVVGIILIGLFVALWQIERKVSRLEKEINKP